MLSSISKPSNALAFALMMMSARDAAATTLITFDRPNLVVVHDQGQIRGFYTGSTSKPSDFSGSDNYECTFMFMSVKGPHAVSLRSLNRPAKDWDSAPYAEGTIKVHGAIWQIHFLNRPRGCAPQFNSDEIVVPPADPGTNLTSYAARGARFEAVKQSPAVGIRWVELDTFLQRRVGRKFVSTVEKLPTGTLVVALRKSGRYTEVEYVDLKENQKVRAWVCSNNLTDPFPKQ